MVGPPAVMLGVGTGFTFTVVIVDVALHPSVLPTVTQYDPAVFTTILCVVAPVFQR